MKLTKAKELLQELRHEIDYETMPDLGDAITLHIAAIDRIIHAREGHGQGWLDYLPGETEE